MPRSLPLRTDDYGMKPMLMKQPSPCCGAPTLLWDKVKWCFVCPCGRLRVNEMGLPGKCFSSFTRAFAATGAKLKR